MAGLAEALRKAKKAIGRAESLKERRLEMIRKRRKKSSKEKILDKVFKGTGYRKPTGA